MNIYLSRDIVVSFVSFSQTFTKSCYFLSVSYYLFFICVFVVCELQIFGYGSRSLAAIPKYVLRFGSQNYEI